MVIQAALIWKQIQLLIGLQFNYWEKKYTCTSWGVYRRIGELCLTWQVG